MMKTTNNPAALGLTDPQFKVYQIVRARYDRGLTIKTADVVKEWGNFTRSYAWKVLKSLCEKGLLRQYDGQYYTLVDNQT